MTGAPSNRNAETMPAAASEPSAPPDTEHSTPPGIAEVLAALSEMRTQIAAMDAKVERRLEALGAEVNSSTKANANAMLNLERSIEGLRTSQTSDVRTLFKRTDAFQERLNKIAQAAAAE